MKKIIVFTDGSSKGNPGPGGWGAVLIFPDKNQKNFEAKFEDQNLKVKEIGGFEKKTTNNRMELTAVIKALEFFLANDLSNANLIINSDSSYVINGASKWVFGWEKNGWKTSTKEDVLNRDLWERFLDISKEINIEWQQIKGHNGVPLNERCDEIATTFSNKLDLSLYDGKSENYFISLNLTEQKKEFSNSKKVYSYVSKVDNEIKVHKTWVECEKRVKGKSKTRFKKTFSREDEEKIIKEFKN